MKTKENIEKTIKMLEIYNILEHYAKFSCKDGDDYTYFKMKTEIQDWKKKYTTEYKYQKLEFEITVHGLCEIFNEMTVLDLITDKYINSFEIQIFEIVTDEDYNINRELLDEYSFGI